ncbi:HigA family addiction module antitoxin [uncultured Zhongshania sp.]|jgi:addiction module HigA family antidote|uniref:HigA family addiction module antitoxin n=1 Tax=uncultured Zhongshania sp. TaxID=1642288 RepID=UPI0025D46C44|nr:HigA family addiction module antitoxin [uncultured Zhongshania sp.]
MVKNNMRPVHPGEILREDYVLPLGLSANRLARDLRVPVTRISKILNEERAVTPDTALRLARYFGGDAQTWLNLQSAYDLKTTVLDHGDEIELDVRPLDVEAA